jgi:hypothetical protein
MQNLPVFRFLKGLGKKMEQVNATQEFLGDETQRAAASIELYDVQGLWGGQRIYVEGGKRAVVQLIQPGMLERRYEFTPGEDVIKRLLELMVENDFLTIKPGERLGKPDEARPRITLVNAEGNKWAVAKWARVQDERFDAILQGLLRLEELTKTLDPVYSGPYKFGT